MPEVPDSHRKKGLEEMMREIANANMVSVIAQGFGEIDRRAEKMKKKLAAYGITGVDELVDGMARIVKRKSVELATGRKQDA